MLKALTTLEKKKRNKYLVNSYIKSKKTICNILKRLVTRKLKQKSTSPIFFDDDVFLVSYPKSGNTWVRFLIGNYLSNGNCSFVDSHLIVPDIDFNPESIANCPQPRVIKSHRAAPQPYKKVIYLVRDGRDVAVSYFYHLKKYRIIPTDTAFHDYLPNFIKGNLDKYGSWGDHVAGWTASATNDLMVIRYEDLKSDTFLVLKKIICFCGFDIDEAKIHKAIGASGVEKMQALEKSQFNDTSLLSNSDPSMMFVRRGEVGDWRNHFDPSMSDLFLKSFEKNLQVQGYR